MDIGYVLMIGAVSAFLWIYAVETVCQAQEHLSDKAAIPAVTNILPTRDQAPSNNLAPANPALPAAPSNVPLNPGSVSPGSGPAFPGQKIPSVPQSQSFPRVERGNQAPSSSAPFSPVIPGTRMDAAKQIDPSFSDMPMRPSVSAGPQRGMVTLNFDDADVYSIIQTIFGTVLKVNYVVDPRIKGRVTFRAVAPVPLENVLPLMEVILRLNGIAVVEESGLYRLVPIGDISKEPSPVNFGRDPERIQVKGKALLQVVPITYVQSSDVLKLIGPFATSNAVLIDVPKSNQIIIVDTDANVKRMLKLVEIFDNEKLRKTKPEVFVYLVQNGKAKDIAGILQQTFLGGKATSGGSVSSAQSASPQSAQSPTGASGASQSSPSQVTTGTQLLVSDFTKFIPDEVTNSIVILSTPDEYVLIKETISKIDTIPRQVLIEGLIAQVTLSDNLSIGLSAWIKGNIGNFNMAGGIGGSNLTGDMTKPSGTGLTLYGIDGVGNLQFMIASLASDSRAKLLATPHILVSDNKEAKIQIGQQVPLVTSETYGSTTLAPQRTIQYRDIGIILKVKPRVNEGGLVSLELYQEVSTYETIPLYANEKQIILNKNDATTSVVVQDGQTIVIGGLIREDTIKAKSGIPFLTKIPFLGWIFGTWLDNKQRTEIIILLTPRVVKNQKQAGEVTDYYIDNMINQSKGRIQKKDLVKEKQRGVDDKGGKVQDAVKEFLRLD